MRATLPPNSRFASVCGGLSDTYPGPSRTRRSIGARPGISSAPAPAAMTGSSASAASASTLGGGAGYLGVSPGSGGASSSGPSTTSLAAATTAGPVGQALLARVNSVSSKVESILGNGKRHVRSPLPISRPSSLGDKLLDLTEKLAHLESLLDEAQSRSIFNPPPRRSDFDSAAQLEAAADATVDSVARSLIAAMNQHQGCCNGHSHTPHHTALVPPSGPPTSGFLQQAVAAAAAAAQTAVAADYSDSRELTAGIPLRNHAVVRQQSHSRAATPLPSSRVQTVQTPGRFVEVSLGASAGVPSAVPLQPSRGLRSPAGYSSGVGSGSLTPPVGGLGQGLTPPVGLSAPAGLRTPNLAPPPAAPVLPGAPPMLPIRGMAESLALGASRQLNGAKTPLNGGSTPRLSFGPGYSPGPFLASRAAAATGVGSGLMGGGATLVSPLDGRMSPPLPFAGVATPTSRNASVSRHPSGQGDGAIRVSTSPLTGFHSPSFDDHQQDRPQKKTEMKIRQWLSTIPIGNGSERGWDDAQIQEIANFAETQGIEYVSAEEMYKRYVEHQVSQAEAIALAEEQYAS
eukprot:TRINITY_DN31181_c0_g1_i1.p1 TRINITY_DN31181_c0_g1~~TRINITY_DN31181_c0_g1_i1.p1  ORF type:complete len:599 (-),score=83.50 TRINITY_DN31181_c0_g1_i1:39-1754(-)